jgi:hypothetical protein
MYNEHFGFIESPFNVTPDPRFFYSNRLYQEAFTGRPALGNQAPSGFDCHDGGGRHRQDHFAQNGHGKI